MIFHAFSDMEYRSGEYRLIWDTMGWQVWNFSRTPSCLIRDVRLPVAMEACEKDARQ